MTAPRARPSALDWLELVQRGCVLVRALNGQTEESITADHARELARAQKVRALWQAVERWASSSDGGKL